jgi:ZIP family zinc transporter
VAAGAMLSMIVDTMIPEAVAETQDCAGLVAVVGFLVSTTLTSLEV